MTGPGPMQVTIQGDRDTVIIRFRGNLDGSSACQVEQALHRVHEKSRGRKLVFDLGGVRTYEYFGVAILARSIRSQRNHFKEITFQGMPTSTEHVFRRFGVDGTSAAAPSVASGVLAAVE
ncbi:MAG: STAS domain-containing protein [Nitrospirota bacterium]